VSQPDPAPQPPTAAAKGPAELWTAGQPPKGDQGHQRRPKQPEKGTEPPMALWRVTRATKWPKSQSRKGGRPQRAQTELGKSIPGAPPSPRALSKVSCVRIRCSMSKSFLGKPFFALFFCKNGFGR
jgi:hypothetical protein